MVVFVNTLTDVMYNGVRCMCAIMQCNSDNEYFNASMCKWDAAVNEMN